MKLIDTRSAEQLTELTMLVNEPFGYETESYADFKMQLQDGVRNNRKKNALLQRLRAFKIFRKVTQRNKIQI